jgi:BirA family biotin operon repressor/biotin-[acetyl-CoA-carboxylase] ligase
MVIGMRGDRARSALAGTRFADLRWVDETGSTNADLLVLARDGAPEGVVLVADHQTAGRGRLGRTWEAPPGSSLLLSVLLDVGAGEDPHLTTVALGVAAAEACGEVCGVTPGLKWPNDLVIDDRKVAGILAEAHWLGSRARVVAGMGLNANWPPEPPAKLAAIATALNHHAGHDVDREGLLVAILRRLDHWRSRPAGELADIYGERCVTLGREVRIELAAETFTGTAVGITREGHLEVQAGPTRRTVTAGDVVHLRPATGS